MKVLRNAISGSRNRYTEEGYDLDLTYIHDRVLAMGYPATGMEKTYRNDVADVSAFLNKKHRDKYMIYNLSERHYDSARFLNRVEECGFPDHHPPPLQVLLDIINRMAAWYMADPDNVVVVHCMAGKGRTGVVITCFLIAIGYFEREYGLTVYNQSEDALADYVRTVNGIFWKRRGQGVRYPSQTRYIYYFIKVLAELHAPPAHFHYRLPSLPPASRLYLRQIVMTGVPNFDNGGCTPFMHVLPAPSEHVKTPILYNSAWDSGAFSSYSSDPATRISFKTDCFVQGDILIRIFHASGRAILGKKESQMCHVTLHTDFLRHSLLTNMKSSIILRKADIDDADGNKRFPDAFTLEMSFDTDVAEEPERPALPLVKPLPTKRGWLVKQGGFVQNWKRRWFVLKDGRLTYYKSEEKLQPLGTVALEGAAIGVCDIRDGKVPRSGFYFKIDPPACAQKKRVYFFGAASLAELDDWLRDLKEHSMCVPPLLMYRSSSSDVRPRSLPIGNQFDDHILGHKMSQSFMNCPSSAPLEKQRSGHRSSLPTRPTSKRFDDYVDDDLRGSLPSNLDNFYHYVYSTDQLITAKELQRHLKRTNELDGFRDLPRADAMQFLVMLVAERYPNLLEAIEDDGDNLIDMIADRRDF
ncbi:phosphatidylinositol-3,4,5-trisphosphate 3-phosphatase [Achlya hypogyna]|uniref:Phosphatidylinositol-3,4,5-trisphosphate 3-phosphatase n=1 Tax=Achlya hypogyna TaxID=1202772 RepID=A0A1V9Y6A1_ACHHY|nr:phosphatidylinositol-3,4,5-trisphosphate 3-phosphatase [Achlya hypogyna]